jgi:hypothetical protein
MTNPNHPASCLKCGKLSSPRGISQHRCFGVRGHEGIRKYWTKKWKSSKYRNIEFKLTGEEMIRLFEEAGITPDQITNRDADGYNLCRVNDTGAYEIGNCYFDTHANNTRDRFK